MNEPITQTVDDLLEETGKDIQESIDILQPIIKNYFVREGYTYPEEDEKEGAVSDKYLRLHFNMVELARYHNLTSLLACMTSIGKVHDKFRSWIEMLGSGQGGGVSEQVLEVYERECTKIYSYCLEILPENLLGSLLIENEINKIRRALRTIIEAFENLQRMRTKYITLDYHDNDSDASATDYLRDLDVDWKELVRAREQLPHYQMLEGKTY